ncbi:hypothetical protein C8A03DRAFT_19748 [Achaetomium macrosporum]|uniref:Uncharacterized protein n=1 Tax=Achaetomium macrosporum TaxID=79813 RepID=A0AAN7H9D8_9PEZI|nr:hypothetical protein C8A03DRAFT_19748 [Achaetomium macrosporum]
MQPLWHAAANRYPKRHCGHEQRNGHYSLTARGPWVEFPVLNGSHIWTPGEAPGPVRAIYNDANRSIFDVVYHDPAAPRNPHGRFRRFTKAEYRPATRPKRPQPPRTRPSSTSCTVPSVREAARPIRHKPPRACKVEVTYAYQRTVCITVGR